MAIPGDRIQGAAKLSKHFKKLNLKNHFLRSIYFKLLSHINVNSKNNCDFLKSIISFRSGYRDDFPQCQKSSCAIEHATSKFRERLSQICTQFSVVKSNTFYKDKCRVTDSACALIQFT